MLPLLMFLLVALVTAPSSTVVISRLMKVLLLLARALPGFFSKNGGATSLGELGREFGGLGRRQAKRWK